MSVTIVQPNSYDAAVLEAHALRGEPKALKNSDFLSIFRAREGESYFAVRGVRSETLRAEGFIEVARMNLAGVVTNI